MIIVHKLIFGIIFLNSFQHFMICDATPWICKRAEDRARPKSAPPSLSTPPPPPPKIYTLPELKTDLKKTLTAHSQKLTKGRNEHIESAFLKMLKKGDVIKKQATYDQNTKKDYDVAIGEVDQFNNAASVENVAKQFDLWKREEKLSGEVLKEIGTMKYKLHDFSVDYFIKMVNEKTKFDMVDTVFYGQAELTEKHQKPIDDVQILYGVVGEKETGHYLTLFYNATENIAYVYDSLKMKYLDEKQRALIEYRYPKKKDIVFVDQKSVQHDSTSCGIFSMAFVTTIALGKDPKTIQFKMGDAKTDESSVMRDHVRQMFVQWKLIPFPEK